MSERVPAANIEEDLRRQNALFLRGAAVLLAVALFLSAVSTTVGWIVLSEVREATSEEARQRQADLVEGLIVSIDCRDRFALQEVIDALVDDGILSGSSIRIVSDDCATHADGSSREGGGGE